MLERWDVLDIGSAKDDSGKGSHMLKLISAMEKWCHFSFFSRAFKQKKTLKALRPKMTKIASRGVLTRDIVLERWDVLDIGSAKDESGKGSHMLKLISAMEDIGISFDNVASRKSGQDLDFTSLMGHKRKKIYQGSSRTFCSRRHAPR